MVSQNLDAQKILDQADTLAFPESVVQYLRGEIGIPPGGFPEPLRSKVLSSRNLEPINGRPGASLPDYNFEKAKEELTQAYGESVTEKDVLSSALYPQVYRDWKDFELVYGDVGSLPTNVFLNPMKVGDEIDLEVYHGRSFLVGLTGVADIADSDGSKTVTFNVNGEPWYIKVTDKSAESSTATREKAGAPGTVGSSMPGVVVGLKVEVGDEVNEGDAVATLSAMKMETVIPATANGIVERIVVNVGDKVEANDLILSIKSE